MKNHEQRTQDLLTGCDTSDTTTNGDSLTIHAEWPNHRKTGHVRAIFINANGLSPRHNNVELEYLIQSCAANQADIIGTVEVNQPLTTPSVRANMKDCVKTFDRYAKVQFGHRNEVTMHRDHQMGGQLMIAQGGINHLIKDSGCDKGGRWM